ncbi:MAG: hypothetical protein AAGB22_06650 [Bacteroidota bacterium]
MKNVLHLLAVVLMATVVLPSCSEEEGCTNPRAENYNEDAESDDGSCRILGCTDPTALNYDPEATVSSGVCLYGGCTDPEAANYDPLAAQDDGSCIIGFTVFRMSSLSTRPFPVPVFIDGELKGTIAAFASSATCDFQDGPGELTVRMAPGTYNLTVGPLQDPIGTVNFVNGVCGEYVIL